MCATFPIPNWIRAWSLVNHLPIFEKKSFQLASALESMEPKVRSTSNGSTYNFSDISPFVDFCVIHYHQWPPVKTDQAFPSIPWWSSRIFHHCRFRQWVSHCGPIMLAVLLECFCLIEPDDAKGVRLKPHSSMKIIFCSVCWHLFDNSMAYSLLSFEAKFC